MASQLSESGDQVYSLAKQKSNDEQYEEATQLFAQAASIFERDGRCTWASKSYSCAAWNAIPLKQFQAVETYINKAIELDGCRGIEGLFHAVYYSLYYARIDRNKAADIDADSYLDHAKQYLSSAIHQIYESMTFSNYKLNSHLAKIRLGLLPYLTYIVEEFFKHKTKDEIKRNPSWVTSNKARHAKIRETLGDDQLGLDEPFTKANLNRFSRILAALKYLQQAELENDSKKILDHINAGILSLPRELSSLPKVIQLKAAIAKFQIGDQVAIKSLINKAIASLNDINYSAATEITGGIYAEKLRETVYHLIQSKMHPLRYRNLFTNILLSACVFIFFMTALPTEFWIKLGISLTITSVAVFYIDKFFPFRIRYDS